MNRTFKTTAFIFSWLNEQVFGEWKYLIKTNLTHPKLERTYSEGNTLIDAPLKKKKKVAFFPYSDEWFQLLSKYSLAYTLD